MNVAPKLPSFLDILLADPDGIIQAIDGVSVVLKSIVLLCIHYRYNVLSLSIGIGQLFKVAESQTLGRRGVVSRFSLPFVGNVVGRSLGAKTGDNFIQKARRIVIGVLEDKLKSFSEEGSTDTVAEVIATALNGLLDDVLKDDIVVTYYEHTETSTIPDLVYNETKDYKSLMWTIPFGKRVLICTSLAGAFCMNQTSNIFLFHSKAEHILSSFLPLILNSAIVPCRCNSILKGMIPLQLSQLISTLSCRLVSQS